MRAKVVVRENRPTDFVYWVEGANSIEEAQQMAVNCYKTHSHSSKCRLSRKYPRSPEYESAIVEIIDFN